MKHVTSLLAVAAIAAAFFLPSCTTDQTAQAAALVQSGIKVADSFGVLKNVNPGDLQKIQAGLTIASRLDLSKGDVASIIAQATQAANDAVAAGLIKQSDADTVKKALAAAEFLWTLKAAFAAQRSHESEFPKLSAIAAASQPPTPQPRVTMILTRREAAQIRRADWLHIDRVTDPVSA